MKSPNKQNKLLLALLLASTVLVYHPKLTYAEETTSTTDTDAVDFEPTTVESLGGTEQGTIPGTEPLYDQGVTITQVEIVGNNNVPDAVILGAIDAHPGTIYNKKRLKSDLEKIYELGYFTEKLRAVPVATRDGIHIRYQVEENPVVKAFRLEGNTVIPTDELMPLFGEQTGMPQNIKTINEGIKALEKTYKDKGYVLARVEGVDEDDDGTVVLKITEGKLHKIAFSGNKKTKDYVLRRALAQKEGQIYNEKTVAEDLKRLYSTQTVSDVRRVIKVSEENPNEYDLTIETDEKKTGTISLGGGADTATGLFVSGGYADPNFMGRGYNVNAMALIGSGVVGSNSQVVRRKALQFQLGFFNPSVFNTQNSLGTSAFAREYGSFNVPLAVERRLGGDINWGRPLSGRFTNSAVSVGLGFENIKINEGTDAATLATYGVPAGLRAGELGDGSYVYLTPSFVNDTRNNRFNPTRGHVYTLSNRFGLGLSDDTYSTVNLNLKRYLRVTDNITLALNGQGAYNYLGSVPEYNQMRMGGSYSVRGYQEGGLGTGEHSLLGSAEIRTKVPLLKKFKKYPIYDMLQVAFFADAGQLFSRPAINDYFNRPGYGVSIGAGLRANLPLIGPLRIDYAIPLVGKGANIQNINFGVGQKF